MSKLRTRIRTHGARKRSAHAGIVQRTQEDGRVTWYAIHPQTGQEVEIDPEQAWFWTETWQAGERQVDRYLAEGRYSDFDDVDDFFDTPVS